MPGTRCALTAPFHPYPLRGGIFSVALSVPMEKLHEPPGLRGTLPCGVRTFLPPNALALSRRPFDLPDGILARISRQVATETIQDRLFSAPCWSCFEVEREQTAPGRPPGLPCSLRGATLGPCHFRCPKPCNFRCPLTPGKSARAPSRSRSDGRRSTRERGRPARMHSRCLPLSFPAMGHPATLPAGTAWARPKQSPGAVAGVNGHRKWQCRPAAPRRERRKRSGAAGPPGKGVKAPAESTWPGGGPRPERRTVTAPVQRKQGLSPQPRLQRRPC